MKIAFISSYIPRKCGIATYTKDLAVEMQKQGHDISVVALENPILSYEYTKPVISIVKQNALSDYKKMAGQLNSGDADIIHLQHEFGLFGGKDGEYILSLARILTKPLLVTFHTVLLTPSDDQKYIIQELARLSRKVIVMDQVAKERLEQIYGLNTSDISIILHGAPEIEKVDIAEAKKKIDFQNTFLVLANNLLSRNKGIEYGIEAVAKASKHIPNLVFLIVGETHPIVKFSEGESYRNELIAQVKRLGLGKSVVFINEYVSIERLKDFLAAADVYITPYLDPEQISSGTLSYAIGAGKACIATEYVYAKEMLANNKGIVVPFRDSDSISKALIDLYNNPAKRELIEKNTSQIGKNMGWPKVSQRHISVYKIVSSRHTNMQKSVMEFIDTPLNLSHLIRLTNSSGIVQHAQSSIPNLRFGFSTDDNARALIVVSQLFNDYHSDEMSSLITLYGNFLNLAQTSNGKFHTFFDSKLNVQDKEDVTDAYGRAIWGLGFHLYTNKLHPLRADAFRTFQKGMTQVDNILDIRTASYTILGLYYFILAYKEDKLIVKLATEKLEILAKLLCKAYKKNSSNDWRWFEEVVTYDNFRVPQALFAAFMITNNPLYKSIAKSSLEFLDESNFDSQSGYFDFIGQDGWHKKDDKKAFYDQQPLEAAGAIEANIFASIALEDKSYLDRSITAFEWFFGNNRNHRPIYDEKTKGVADGLTPRGVNYNQGAESIVCFLMAQSVLKQKVEYS